MAQGYTRQSTANIVNGAVIDALYLNNEFNQLEAAMNAVSGHTHDGTTGQGGIITMASISGILAVSAGGTGVSAGAFTTSGQLLISPAANQLSVYSISTGLKISGTKLEHNMTGSGAIAISGAQITINVSAPLAVSGTQLAITLASGLKISAGKLDLAAAPVPIGLIYLLS